MVGDFYPYSRKDVAAFFRRHPSFHFVYVKAERGLEDFGHYLCEIIVKAGGERLFLQGIQFRGNRFHYPPYLEEIPNHIRTQLEREVLTHLLKARVIESPLADPALAYTGERIIPGTAPFHAYWIHARRYQFAAKWCRGKGVLDAGCGIGYGTKMLALEAQSCLGVDNDPGAVALAQSLFTSPGLTFAEGDITRLDDIPDASFEVAVALEVLEHLPSGGVEGFVRTVRRVLAPSGTFIVSVANRIYQAQEQNPYHLCEMTFDELKGLLETYFDASGMGIQYFGQDVWEGSYRLDRECRIEPIQTATEHHIYLAVAQRTGTR